MWVPEEQTVPHQTPDSGVQQGLPLSFWKRLNWKNVGKLLVTLKAWSSDGEVCVWCHLLRTTEFSQHLTASSSTKWQNPEGSLKAPGFLVSECVWLDWSPTGSCCRVQRSLTCRSSWGQQEILEPFSSLQLLHPTNELRHSWIQTSSELCYHFYLFVRDHKLQVRSFKLDFYLSLGDTTKLTFLKLLLLFVPGINKVSWSMSGDT